MSDTGWNQSEEESGDWGDFVDLDEPNVEPTIAFSSTPPPGFTVVVDPVTNAKRLVSIDAFLEAATRQALETKLQQRLSDVSDIKSIVEISFAIFAWND
eukprot:UN04706